MVVLGCTCWRDWICHGANLLDPLAATLVSAMIMKVAEILYDSINELSDKIDRNVLNEIAGVAKNVDGVNRVENVRARRSGRVFS